MVVVVIMMIQIHKTRKTLLMGEQMAQIFQKRPYAMKLSRQHSLENSTHISAVGKNTNPLWDYVWGSTCCYWSRNRNANKRKADARYCWQTRPLSPKRSKRLYRFISPLTYNNAGIRGCGQRGGDRKTREQLTENKCMACPFALHRCFSPEPQSPLGVERTTVVLYRSHACPSIGLVIKVVIICRINVACLHNSLGHGEKCVWRNEAQFFHFSHSYEGYQVTLLVEVRCY